MESASANCPNQGCEFATVKESRRRLTVSSGNAGAATNADLGAVSVDSKMRISAHPHATEIATAAELLKRLGRLVDQI